MIINNNEAIVLVSTLIFFQIFILEIIFALPNFKTYLNNL